MAEVCDDLAHDEGTNRRQAEAGARSRRAGRGKQVGPNAYRLRGRSTRTQKRPPKRPPPGASEAAEAASFCIASEINNPDSRGTTDR